MARATRACPKAMLKEMQEPKLAKCVDVGFRVFPFGLLLSVPEPRNQCFLL